MSGAARRRRRAPASWQPRQPAFWILAVGILACVPLQLRGLIQQEPPAEVLGISLLVGAIEVLLFWAIALLLSRDRPRPVGLRLVALAWGLAVVQVIASFSNTHYFSVLNGLGLHAFAASIAAPVDEDLLRFVGTLGVLALAAQRRITARDGLVYGFLVGAGFEVSENLAFLFSSTDLAGTVQLALIRLGIGFGLHALWTGISGAALAYVLARRRAGMPARWRVAALGLLAPMLLHALWDAPAPSIHPLLVFAVLGVVYAVTLAAFGGILVATSRRARDST
ncbi:PrsW family glutamic-type intramembrane protease [Leucobacter soli]|uniref:Protease PrsW n=1 Tax=Leucobacter soli TaxID=2812850 RepID=A0A916K141_9MICO|nr:PrsW family glutamic-type intramembrane protease [Leucobacter soli]CAG7616853.1 hypothetical protein LEUCIP111803_02032 [Leucobacter soli]